MISVALCTYNGEKYIKEQLESIANQTLPVDEIVICDDGSKDNTLLIIESVKQTNSIPIRVIKNNISIGVVENFKKAISLCNGDIIFLSDQDDIWMQNKTLFCINYLNNNPQIDTLFTNAKILDGGKKNIEKRDLFDFVGFSRKMQHFFSIGYSTEIISENNIATGATMAIKKEIVPLFEKKLLELYKTNFFTRYNMYHDAVILALAVDRGTIGFIREKLIYYRKHDNQVAGVGTQYNPPFRSIYYKIKTPQTWLSELISDPILLNKIQFQYKRNTFNLYKIIRNYSKYKKYYSKRWMLFVFNDVCLCIIHSIFKNWT